MRDARPARRSTEQEIPALIRRAVRRVTRELDAARAEAELRNFSLQGFNAA